MSDSISNFVTNLRNASMARKDVSVCLFSKVHLRIAEILKEEGFIRDVQVVTDSAGRKNLKVLLKYVEDTPALTNIKRISTPGCRRYCGYDEIPRVLGGLGIAILTTSRGVMKDREAKAQKVGGELLCTVW